MAETRRRDFLKKTGTAALAMTAGAHLAPAAENARGVGKRKVKIGQIGTGHAHAAGKPPIEA